jgi:glycerol-3-phosphate acyltransferase PlsY
VTGFLEGTQPGWLLVAAVVGYAVGSINPAAIIAKVRGIDLSAAGSGNPGATNAGRVMGPATGVLVAVIDIGKGFLPAYLFARYSGDGTGEVAGFMAVVGHITSPFLHGHGGKGVATTLGAVLAVHVVWVPFVLLGFAIGYVTTRRMGIAAVSAALVLIGCGAVTTDPDLRVFGILLGLLVIVRHWRNLATGWQDWRGRGEARRDT